LAKVCHYAECVCVMQMNQASDEFLKGYFSTHERSKKTKDAYCSDLTQFLSFAGEDMGLLSLSSVVIENWAAHLQQEGYSPTSIRRKIVVLRVFCSYWVRKGGLTESPFWRVKFSLGRIEKLPRTLTEDEVRSLLYQAQHNHSIVKASQNVIEIAVDQLSQVSPSTYRELRNLALIDILFATGMRVGEVSALDVQDYLVKEAIFKVKGKGGRNRLAFIVDEETLRVQRAHIETRKRIESKSPALFLNASGERLSTQGIANVIAQLRQDAGIDRHITPHMLRHTVATLMLRNGVDIRVVQEFLGHASIATTQRYTHITKEHLVGVLRKYHPSFGVRSRR
jgi:integrase/recombinase XerD